MTNLNDDKYPRLILTWKDRNNSQWRAVSKNSLEVVIETKILDAMGDETWQTLKIFSCRRLEEPIDSCFYYLFKTLDVLEMEKQ